MAQTLGLITLNWRGQDVPVKKGGKVTLGGLKQNPVIVGQQVNFANEFKESTVKCVTDMVPGQSLVGLFAPGQGPVIIECDTGQTYSWPDMFLTDRPGFTAGGGGEIPLEFAGGAPIELLAAQS